MLGQFPCAAAGGEETKQLRLPGAQAEHRANSAIRRAAAASSMVTAMLDVVPSPRRAARRLSHRPSAR